MERYVDGWKSTALGDQREIAVYGHYGPAMLLLPFDGENYAASEEHGMIEHLAPVLDAGRIKIFTIGSADRESWLSDDVAPRQKSLRHQQYNRYVLEEVVPFIEGNMRGAHPLIYTSGISLGALHAVNLFLRRPNIFAGTIGISGIYDLKAFTNGYHDKDVYYNSPMDYLTNLTGPTLSNLRQKQSILLVAGAGEGEHPEASREMGELMGRKGIPNWVDIWGEEFGHNWDAWHTMLRTVIERHF